MNLWIFHLFSIDFFKELFTCTSIQTHPFHLPPQIKTLCILWKEAKDARRPHLFWQKLLFLELGIWSTIGLLGEKLISFPCLKVAQPVRPEFRLSVHKTAS